MTCKHLIFYFRVSNVCVGVCQAEWVFVHSPIRSGPLSSALRSGRRALLPGWRKQRCLRRPHRPQCWSPGLWSLCGASPSWGPCTDSSDSTWAQESRWISASLILRSGGQRGGQQWHGTASEASLPLCSGGSEAAESPQGDGALLRITCPRFSSDGKGPCLMLTQPLSLCHTCSYTHLQTCTGV